MRLGLVAWGQNCSNSNFKGNYGFLVTGPDKHGTPTVSVGHIKSDGQGNFTGMESVSSNGQIFTNAPATGTYTINADCTGSGTITPQGGNTSGFGLVVISGGKTLQILATDAGTVQVGVAVAQGNATCTNAGVQGTYGVLANGTFVGIGGFALNGLVTLDGAGKLSGTESGSIAGQIFGGAAVSGSYKIKANCTGTATFKVTGEPTQHAGLVVVNGGKELLVMETDANTVVAGTAQK